jgi:hypothetical protein
VAAGLFRRAPPRPGPGFWQEGAGGGAGQDAASQDVGDRAVQPQCHPLPGRRQPGAEHVISEADVARGVHGPLDLDLDHVTGCRGQRWRPGGAGTGRGEAGQVAGACAPATYSQVRVMIQG